MAARKGKAANQVGTVAPVAPVAPVVKKTRVVEAKYFRVVSERDKSVIYVKAKSRVRAIAYAAEALFRVRIATGDELFAAGRDGIEVHDNSLADEPVA